MLALSLIGWVALCTWVWMMLGNTDNQSVSQVLTESDIEVAVSERSVPLREAVKAHELPVIEALPEVDALPEVAASAELDAPPEVETPAAYSELPVPDRSLPPTTILPDSETVEAVQQPAASYFTDSATAESSSAEDGEPVAQQSERETVLDSTATVLPELAELLEGFGDPEGLDEAEEPEPVVIPLASAPAETIETTYERQRQEELSVLAGLSSRLKFAPSSAERAPRVQTVLDRIFDPLFLYADTNVEVIVNSNDLASPADNRQLSRQRGRVIVDYLAQRGLDTSRFVVVSEGGRGLAIGDHRVQVISEVLP